MLNGRWKRFAKNLRKTWRTTKWSTSPWIPISPSPRDLRKATFPSSSTRSPSKPRSTQRTANSAWTHRQTEAQTGKPPPTLLSFSFYACTAFPIGFLGFQDLPEFLLQTRASDGRREVYHFG